MQYVKAKPMNYVIGIGEYVISADPADTIKTYALASCVAVTLYSPSKKTAGMIHVALPHSVDEEHARQKPGYYATIGVPLLIEKMCKEFGCIKSELRVQLFGGAQSIRQNDSFNIGTKNVNVIKNILMQMGLNYYLTEVGGNISRTITMDVATGSIKVHTQPIRI